MRRSPFKLGIGLSSRVATSALSPQEVRHADLLTKHLGGSHPSEIPFEEVSKSDSELILWLFSKLLSERKLEGFKVPVPEAERYYRQTLFKALALADREGCIWTLPLDVLANSPKWKELFEAENSFPDPSHRLEPASEWVENASTVELEELLLFHSIPLRKFLARHMKVSSPELEAELSRSPEVLSSFLGNPALASEPLDALFATLFSEWRVQVNKNESSNQPSELRRKHWEETITPLQRSLERIARSRGLSAANHQLMNNLKLTLSSGDRVLAEIHTLEANAPTTPHEDLLMLATLDNPKVWAGLLMNPTAPFEISRKILIEKKFSTLAYSAFPFLEVEEYEMSDAQLEVLIGRLAEDHEAPHFNVVQLPGWKEEHWLKLLRISSGHTLAAVRQAIAPHRPALKHKSIQRELARSTSSSVLLSILPYLDAELYTKVFNRLLPEESNELIGVLRRSPPPAGVTLPEDFVKMLLTSHHQETRLLGIQILKGQEPPIEHLPPENKTATTPPVSLKH